MKTVCKKLLSLMLVAILLISAVPMAFATDGGLTAGELTTGEVTPPAPGPDAGSGEGNKDNADPATKAEPVVVKVRVDLDGKMINDSKSITLNEGEKKDLTKELAESMINDMTGREFVKWSSTSSNDLTGQYISYEWASQNANSDYRLIINLKSVNTPCVTHTWDEGTVTKEPTCTANGIKTFTCTKCGDKKTETVLALNHNFVNDVCTRCGEREPHELTFIYLDTNNKEVKAYQRIKHGENISFPSAYNVEGKRIDYWFNVAATGYAEGEIKYNNTTGQKWYYNQPLVYKAHYIVDTVQDNTAKLTIWANYYAGGVRQTLKLYDKSFTKSSYDNEMYRWLNDKAGGIATIQNEVKSHFGDDYQWADNNNYYDVNGKAIPSTMKDDGAKAIYINLTAKDATKAKVLVYVHLRDSKNNNKIIVTADRVIPMENYVKGDVVYASNVQKAVEGKYKFKEMSKLYTAKEFDRLIDGQNPTGANAVTVPEGGIEIHVVLNNATNKTTSNADKSNPKTGDNIDVVFTTMTISAMGLAAVAVLKKRKMI